MAGASRRFWRACVTWLRVVLPPWWSVALFLVVLVAFEVLAHTLLRGPNYREATQPKLDLMLHTPRDIWLAFALVLYGFSRVLAKHPLFRPAYAEWLAGTPWHGQLALPLGPIHLVPQDGLILLAAWLVSRHDSRLDIHALAALCMLPYLFGLIVALRVTGAGAHAYLVAYGLAAAVWLGLPSPGATLLLIPLYCVGWHGLPISLRGLFVNNSSRLREAFRKFANIKPSATPVQRKTIGFPLAQLGPGADYPAISLGESLLVSWLAAAWVFALASRNPDPGERVAIGYVTALMGVGLATLARGAIYCSEYRPPITLAGRLTTGRWLIRGYDRVFLPFVCAGAVILALHPLLLSGVRNFALGPLALGIGLSILLGMPPRLRDWALTGHHRIVADPFARGEFIEI